MKNLNEDIESMSLNDLKNEVIKLRDMIRYHKDQKLNDRCWLDDIKLYECLPEACEGYDSTLPSENIFLENCKIYCRNRQIKC